MRIDSSPIDPVFVKEINPSDPDQPVTAVGRTFRSELTGPDGIGTGAAYADLDAIGQPFPVVVPVSGVIQTVLYHDKDDEGLAVALWLFDSKPAAATDNSALVVSDSDMHASLGTLQITTSMFADGNTGQLATYANVGMAYVCPSRVMWVQAQARGALNIAAANLPLFRFIILADE